jgi:hypothetical protein
LRARYIPVKRAGAIVPCQTAVPDRDLLLGVALSGGGSRAALFGAAGLEALARVQMSDGTSLIDQVTHLSSVSGGSIAAAYYALKKPGCEVKVLNADGTLSEVYRAFFARARADLSQNFQTSLIWRQLLSFRWINSALAAHTLADILAARLYGDARMEHISAREKAGDNPGLIVNTTLYNNGRRLAVTTLPGEAFDYDFFEELERSLQQRGRVMEPAPGIRQRWELLRPMTPSEIHMDPCPLPLSAVVTASASFPPLIGPITMRIGGEETYWHVGDGGLYENSGVESLLFLYLKRLQEGRAKRALIIAFDSSFPFSVDERRLSLRSLPFSLWTFDFSRVPCIMEERVSSYPGALLPKPADGGGVPRLEDRQPHCSSPHRRQVGDGSERPAARLPGGGGAAPDPPGSEGTHCRDPNAFWRAVRRRPSTPGLRRRQAGRRAPRRDSRVPEPPVTTDARQASSARTARSRGNGCA